ncbi:MAG: hypothetical protein JXR77_04675 [Lentisphaeria bacterium]|nr:hypothetical protein [Lentisphaeria bacterium]
MMRRALLCAGTVLCAAEGAGAAPASVSERMTYAGALLGRLEPRQDLPAWMRVPRWCTTDSPPWGKGETAALVHGFADRHAEVLRLGMFWGGMSHYPSAFAPHSPSLRADVDPLAEALAAARDRNMRVLAYLNPNAVREGHPLFDELCIVDESGRPWDVKAYGREGTRYVCLNNPAFLAFYSRAIAELVGDYGADGIYVDGLSPHICGCRHCREKFRADTGQDLPQGIAAFGPLTVLWEMTSDWDVVGEVDNPSHRLYSRWLMRCLTESTQAFAAAARSARKDAVVVFHTWPKPDTLSCYDGTLNEIYASRPWTFTLWKRAEFSNWGDVFAVPSLVNIYLRQEPWNEPRRPVTSAAEARHLYWQVLANGAYPNSWNYLGMERPFAVMRDHADCLDFPTTFPTPFLALPRPMFAEARHRAVGANTGVCLQPGCEVRLRILEREPGGRIDMLCLRADGRPPSDDDCRRTLAGAGAAKAVYLPAAAFDARTSVTAAGGRRWTRNDDPLALGRAHMVSEGHGNTREPALALTYRLPPLASPGPWALWARVVFPGVGSDSFYWQVSGDGGATWSPDAPHDGFAVGWEQPQAYAWVRARAVPRPAGGAPTDRFLSPPTGMFAALLHAGLPVRQMHPNHIHAASLDGFRIVVLANEVCLSNAQCAMLLAFVRGGGGLIATHETSLYDLEGRRRDDFGLAEVFGVTLQGTVPPAEGQRVVPTAAAGMPAIVPPEGLANREEHLAVLPRDAAVAARLLGPGVPGEGVPALTLKEMGQGRVAYLPGRLDSTYSVSGQTAFVRLMGAAVDWVARGRVPVQVTCAEGLVGATCFDQPSRNRRLVHLVSYAADWAAAFDRLAPVANVQVRLEIPAGRRLRDVRALLSGTSLTRETADHTIRVTLPSLDEYEILELSWEPGEDSREPSAHSDPNRPKPGGP